MPPVGFELAIPASEERARALGYVLRASDRRARTFPPTHLSGQTHVCKWSCPAFKRVASERAKRTLWLVAATKLVCPLLPGRSCEGAAIRSHAEIIGKKECDNRHCKWWTMILRAVNWGGQRGDKQ